MTTMASTLLLLLMLSISSFSINGSAFYTLNTDKEALISFISQITQNPQTNSLSWDQNTSTCNWTGVSCNTRNQRVISVDLSGQTLIGSISPSIGNLSFLKSLELQNNQLQGVIPEAITKLFRLKLLNLSSNSLEGSLPYNITKLSNLQILDLSSNKITGLVPYQFGDLNNLKVLKLGKNLLYGPIPPSISNMSSLTVLSLGTNSFNGPIPYDLSRLEKLQVLDLTINNLTGLVPPSIYNMSSLVSLILASNNLWGQFPSNIGETLPNLLVFNMCFNRFSGEIPASLHNLTNIKVIRAAHNLLEGSIPPGLGNLPFLEMYNFGFNKLVWDKDQGFDQFIKSLANSTKLYFLGFDENQLEGVFPESIGNLSKDLLKLFMGGNRFTGKIPESIANLTSLTLLNMTDNSISGEIPQEFGNLRGLQVLELAGNQLVGRIPDSLANLGSLNDINLSRNKLQGLIPKSFGNFKNVLSMDFSNNMLNGSIPREILNLPSLSTVLNLSKNLLSGPIPQGISQLENLMSLDLSDNHLSSNIPLSIKGCKSLEKLNMARNDLAGSIPDTLAELKGLEFLDLSSNRLLGYIPSKLQDLQALQFLNLSFNNLEGWIPSNGVFKDRSKAHMEGNPKLCIHVTCQKTHIIHGKLLKASIIIACAVSLIAISILTFLIFLSKRRKSSNLITSASSQSSPNKQPFMNFSYDELKKATDNFNSRNLIGFGSFGSVFKGIIREVNVAVKVIDLKANGYYKGFIAECEALRNVRHRNLVKLITSCASIDFNNNEFLALVYEFMSNGSLEDWIKGKKVKSDKNGLSLKERVNVIIYVATALDYLHNDCEIPVVHCDIKPSNILLNEEMVAKVGDFGLARVLFETSEHERLHASISSAHVLKGSIGYIPPEYGVGEKPSKAGDVYSFGIMLLELFSGKSPMDEMFEGDENLVKWISYGFKKNVMEVIDPKLMGLMNGYGPQLPTKLKCVGRVIEIGLACTAYAASERIGMRDVLRVLKEAKDIYVKGN